MAHLVVCRGTAFERVVELARDVVTLGADPEADHRLADPAMPRGAMRFTRTGGAWSVAAPAHLALKVNGAPVTQVALTTGARLEIGPFRLHLVVATAPIGDARRRRTMDALFRLAEGVHSAVGSAGLLDGVMDSLLRLFEAERGFILLEEGGRLLPRVARKLDLESSDRFSQTVATDVFATARPRLIRDAAADPLLARAASIVAGQIRSIIAAPLLRGTPGKPAGVIYLDGRMAERLFDEEDLALLQASAAHVVAALDNSSERERLQRRAESLAEVVDQEVKREYDPRAIVGKAEGLAGVFQLVQSVAAQDTAVLITGESGTGKELVARTLHDLSPRRDGPFVAVNCTALSPALLESELFGHEKGAFTGAHERRQGRFECAQGGTLFLDEVGELAPELQVKLLRVLQERTIERVGSAQPLALDVRLVCATNIDLKRAVAERRFRDDLYYRIAVFPVKLPALRERRGDIPSLVRHFVLLFRARMGKRIDSVDAEAMDRLTRYAWPGNIRELRNVIERAFVVERSQRISADSLPFDMGEEVPPVPVPPPTAKNPRTLASARDEFEKRFVLECLARHGGKVSGAARELDVPRSTIYRKLEAWGVPVDGKGE